MDKTIVATEIDPPDADGGLQYLDWSLSADGLGEAERGIVQSLGAAVVARWNALPREVQKLLFETAARGEGSPEALRGHIARFLHENAHNQR